MEIAELIESFPQAQEQRLQTEEESVGLKANLRRLTLRDISNLHDAEHAIDSTLEHVGSLEHTCAEQEATLRLQAADLEAAHLSEGGLILCITGKQRNVTLGFGPLNFYAFAHQRVFPSALELVDQ